MELDEEPLFSVKGKCSHFGGPDDMGVSENEGLAFIYSVEEAPHLFLPETALTSGTGLARRLNPNVHYVACRWDYSVTPKEMLASTCALVGLPRTDRAFRVYPADWGPHKDTGRVADLSPKLMEDLGVQTDDEVYVVFPYRGSQ